MTRDARPTAKRLRAALREHPGERVDKERVAAVLARLGVTHAPERRAGRVPASER